jgi:hypothetical protein
MKSLFFFSINLSIPTLSSAFAVDFSQAIPFDISSLLQLMVLDGEERFDLCSIEMRIALKIGFIESLKISF